MADNTTLPGTGDVIASDDVSGVKYQRVKLDIGGDGVSTPVTSGTPLPVAGAVTISGTPAVTVGNFPSYTGLTNTELRATPVPISGTFWQATQPVSISSMPTTPVTGTFWQSTQPVSIVTMPTTPVTGTFWQTTQPVSGPLTDTQLRAAPVDVNITSGGGSGGLTNTELRATPVPVTSAATDVSTTGSITANGQSITLATAGNTALYVHVRGTYVATVNFEGTYDGTNYVAIRLVDVSTGATVTTATASATVIAKGDIGGMQSVRARSSAYTSGTAVVDLRTSGTADAVTITSPIPAGANTIGAVTFPSAQAVTISSGTVTTVTTVGTVSAITTYGAQGAVGAAVAGRPLNAGSRASTTNPTAVADTFSVWNRANKKGDLVVVPNQVRELRGSASVTLTTTTETTLIAAVAATFNDITALSFSNSSATAVTVSLRSTTGGAVLKSWTLPPGSVGGPPITVPWPQAAVNTNWTVQLSGAVSSVIVNVDYIAEI